MGVRHGKCATEMTKKMMCFTTDAHEESSKFNGKTMSVLKELLERANTKPLSEEVKWRGWKMSRHVLRQDQDNDCSVAMTWAPEGKRKRGKPKTTWSLKAL